MNRHARFLVKLAELALEYKMLRRGEELVLSRLRWEDWASLRQETVAFAQEEIRRRKWRGARGGVLPGGRDAEDVAGQAIGELLSGKGRLAPGWTRERLVRELRRLVGRRVRVLHGLREASAMRSEWEAVAPQNGAEPVSVFEGMADGSEAAAERQEMLVELRRVLEKHLEREPELRGLFGCLCAGITKPEEIARRLGMEQREVRNARKRLERRLAGFRGRLKAEG
jgi:hypothetical protein